jgi:predicted nucleic acid-binding protein
VPGGIHRQALLYAALHGPDPKPVRDGLIAATALGHSLVVVTRNLGDFAATGVPLLNPWQQG